MNLNQFTVKAQEAVVDAQSLAVKKSHQSVDPEHLLFALLNQDDGLVPQVLGKIANHAPKALLQEVQTAVDKKPEVHGNVQTYTSSQLNKILAKSEDESKKLRDDFVSTKHLFLLPFQIF